MDKCLPFGSSISYRIFQSFSDVIAFVVTYRTGKLNINYLDDFLFVSFLRAQCKEQVEIFIEVCNSIKLPVALDKTTWGDTIIIFLGLLIDIERQVVCIPVEKIEKSVKPIHRIQASKKHKATILQIQQLAGFLNFLCHAIIPGRAFTTRLYSLISNKLQPHHHVKIPTDVREDLDMWSQFLEKVDSSVYCCPFMDFLDWTAEDITMFSDASKNKILGFGAYCQNDWMNAMWPAGWIIKADPSIEFLELFALTAGVLTWIHRIWLFCDNESVVHMVNKSSSTCGKCMKLIRLIVLEGMKQNVRINVKHIR